MERWEENSSETEQSSDFQQKKSASKYLQAFGQDQTKTSPNYSCISSHTESNWKP